MRNNIASERVLSPRGTRPLTPPHSLPPPGDKDHVRHAMDLFIDFAAIFARILVRRQILPYGRRPPMREVHKAPPLSTLFGPPSAVGDPPPERAERGAAPPRQTKAGRAQPLRPPQVACCDSWILGG